MRHKLEEQKISQTYKTSCRMYEDMLYYVKVGLPLQIIVGVVPIK